jgi:hypothetical protein
MEGDRMIFKRCKHDWKVIINQKELSQYEKMMQSTKNFSAERLSPSFFKGKRIIILQCVKCGKLDKTIEEC